MGAHESDRLSSPPPKPLIGHAGVLTKNTYPLRRTIPYEEACVVTICCCTGLPHAFWACRNIRSPIRASGDRRFAAEGAVDDNRRSHRAAHDTHRPALVWIDARPEQRNHLWLQHGRRRPDQLVT